MDVSHYKGELIVKSHQRPVITHKVKTLSIMLEGSQTNKFHTYETHRVTVGREKRNAPLARLCELRA